VTVCCLTLLAGSAAAQAEQRYAAPAATGVTCKQSEPCSLEDAINGASANDEIIVTAGEYTVTGAPINVVYAGLRIDGDPGGPMPRVTAALGGLPAINLSAEGVELSNIEFVNRETEAIGVRCFNTATVERVRASGVGEGAAGLVQMKGCLVRDSLLRGEGTNSLGMESLAILEGEPAEVVRNVTAIATGQSSVGIQSRYTGPSGGHHTLVLSNSIASGDAFDLRAEDSLQGPGVIDVANSNFDTVSAEGSATISGPANQTTQPVFLDAGAGDYREAPGSPTVDAGSSEGVGALDLAGNPRLLGPAPDIGAFEFVPPPTAATLTSLSLSPKSFRPRARGSAIVSKARKKGGGGAVARYQLTAAATVEFTVEEKLPGRRIGGKCRRQTAANREKKRCTRYRALKGGFTDQGVAGPNSFTFSGRIGGKALRPGRYRLVGQVGASSRRAGFTIAG
jgi:hypothetical protein